jgi:hypothetical protein
MSKVKHCPKGKVYSIKTRSCERAGAPGTCANKQKYQPSKWVDSHSVPALFPEYLDVAINHTANDELFCSIDAIQKAGCQTPTNCSYRVPDFPLPDVWTENIRCGSYVRCTTNPAGGGKTGRAQFVKCMNREEYSSETGECEVPSVGGTCTANKQRRSLSERVWDHSLKIVTKPPKDVRSVDIQEGGDENFCSIDVVRKAGYQDPTNCSCPFPVDLSSDGHHETENFSANLICHSYVLCTAKAGGDGKTGRFELKFCDAGKEFSNKTIGCELAGAAGTCSEERIKMRSLIDQVKVPVSAESTSTPNHEIPDGFKCYERYSDAKCTRGNFGRHPNPKDRHSYLECGANPHVDVQDGSEESAPQIKHYPAGEEGEKPLEWNRMESKCDWAGAPGTCSGEANATEYGLKCPKLNITYEDLADERYVEFTVLHAHYKTSPTICNAVVNCFPYPTWAPAYRSPPVMFCAPGQFWDTEISVCENLAGNGNYSTCEVAKNFKCPRKISVREDCEEVLYAGGSGTWYRCTSSKGPEWNIVCAEYAGNYTAYEMRCPFDSVFDLKAGGKCMFPDARGISQRAVLALI